MAAASPAGLTATHVIAPACGSSACVLSAYGAVALARCQNFSDDPAALLAPAQLQLVNLGVGLTDAPLYS